MRRRDFIKGITVLATWSVAARAQQTAETHRIALVHPSISTADMSESGGNRPYVALFGELRRLGYIEGVNLVVARYSGEGREEHFLELCQEIAHTKPDIIVASSSRLALSCKAATATVPIVATMADPIPSGIVVNIARPEGNIAGVSSEAASEIWGKRLQILREVVPTASKVGFLGSHQIWSQPALNELRKAAQQLGISLLGRRWKPHSKSKNIAAYWRKWHRSVWMGSLSAINQNTPAISSLLLTWCVPPNCQRFSPIVRIL